MAKLRPRITTELGEEIQCSKCLDFWPLNDSEFWPFPKCPWCKACYAEYRSERRKGRLAKSLPQPLDVPSSAARDGCIPLSESLSCGFTVAAFPVAGGTSVSHQVS